MLAFYLSMIDPPEDKDKFKELYLKYKQPMYAMVYKILKNATDAEDAVQIAFFKVANNFANISQKSPKEIRSYIVVACKNAAIDMYRENKRTLAKNIYVEHEEDIPDRTPLDEGDYEALRAAIKELPQKYKDVLFLFELEGHSAKETAEYLNITVDAVYKRLKRARSKLREILEKGEVHAE